jgi:hypothetical protein
MAKVLTDDSNYTAIANAIRAKKGVETTYLPSEMAAAINTIDTSGITPTGSISITQNGTVDVTQYASAVVNVSAQTLPSASGVSF